MYNAEPGAGRFYAVNHNNDTATVARGALIPDGNFSYTPSEITGGIDINPISSATTVRPRLLGMAAILLLGTFSFSAVPLFELSSNSLSALLPKSSNPPVIIENPYTREQTPLNYGVNVTFTEPSFFIESRDAFIDAGKSFVEADLTTLELRVFKDGVLHTQVPIVSKGQKGSWTETPAGLYEIESKEIKYFSPVGQVYYPWNVIFQGNFAIHGWPYYESGEPVVDDFLGGSIRLSNTDAEAIYNVVDVAMPVLVYEAKANLDNFVYEPKIPELDTPNYLIADVESSTVLASSDLSTVVPIASLTKLMTAVVAAENINLDSSVSVSQPTFVQSLVPRLGERSTVSMYSLLQLLLVESSNEAAEVIAAQIDRDVFMARMNEKAAAIGMTQTVFADPSGLSSENVSTVRDQLRLIQYIYDHRRFVIELTANQDLPTVYVSGEFGKLLNFNKVEHLDNFIGGKVGETLAAGQTSVTLHTLKVKGQDRVLAIVLLGSDSRNDDVRELLTYAEERFGY